MANVIQRGPDARRWSSSTTRPSPPSSTRSSRSSSPTTRWSTSSATTTTTSPRRTSRSATSTSRRTPRSTTTSTACGWRPPARLVSRRDVIIVASVSCIYGLGSPGGVPQMMVVPGRAGRTVDRDELLAQAGGHAVRAERRRTSSAARFRVRGDTRRDLPGLRGVRLPRSSSSATRSSGISPDQPDHRRGARATRPGRSSTRPCTTSCRRSAIERAAGEHRARSWTSGSIELRNAGQAAGGPAARAPARGTTWRCCWRSATARASRTTRRHLDGRAAGAAPVHADRLLSRGLPARSSTSRT